MTSISPARFALAALIAGFAGAAHAQPAQTPKPQPEKTGDAGGPTASDAKESPALAQARELYLEGNEHYSAGRYVLAAERFIKAYELSGKPALLFNLANTYERAGNYEKAAHYLRLYSNGGDVHDPAAVKARLQRLELTVIEQKKTADNAANPAPAAPPTTDTADKPEPVAAARPSPVPYYIAGGGVVIGAATAVVFGLRASSARSEIDGLCTKQGDGVICPPAAETHLDNERRYALFSDIGIGVAAASLATGVIYYLVTRDSGSASEPTSQALSIMPAASGDALGVVAAGRF